jgi:hypothetical protein
MFAKGLKSRIEIMILRRNQQKALTTWITVGRDKTTYTQKNLLSEGDLQEIPFEGVEEFEDEQNVLIGKTALEIIEQINARLNSPYYSVYCAISSVILFVLISRASNFIAYIFLPILLLASLATYQDDVRRKTTPLFYRFSDKYSERKFEEGINCFSTLGQAKRIWQLKSRVLIDDWKRNAGLESVPIRHITKVGKQKPKFLKTNIEVWGVDCGRTKIYLFPDRFLIFNNGLYDAVLYSKIRASIKDYIHLEQESPPNDAKIVGKRWKNIRRDGERDRRFKNNRQLPEIQYGLITLSHAQLNIYLMISSVEIARSFVKSFFTFLPSSQDPSTSTNVLNEEFDISSLEKDNTLESFEILREAASNGTLLGTKQIAEVLEVSPSSITRKPHAFEYEGFRFTRSGRIGRQIGWKVECLR